MVLAWVQVSEKRALHLFVAVLYIVLYNRKEVVAHYNSPSSMRSCVERMVRSTSSPVCVCVSCVPSPSSVRCEAGLGRSSFLGRPGPRLAAGLKAAVVGSAFLFPAELTVVQFPPCASVYRLGAECLARAAFAFAAARTAHCPLQAGWFLPQLPHLFFLFSVHSWVLCMSEHLPHFSVLPQCGAIWP